MKYFPDHKKISFDIKLNETTKHLSKRNFLITRINTSLLRANLITDFDEKNKRFKFKLVELDKTPHYEYLKGNKEPYRRYLERWGTAVGFGIEHSPENFDRLIHSKLGYLSGINRSKYILVEKRKRLLNKKYSIVDGVHRAAIIRYRQGSASIPVAILSDKTVTKEKQFVAYLNDFKNDFKEWYTPVSFGKYVINERTFPNFKERPEYLLNKERGESKWNYIIKPNLPSLLNKTVCDIGCNIGLFSIFMSKMGAIKVDGFDRNENIFQPTNLDLPKQNVVQQAYFIKNLFELYDDEKISNVNYFDQDILNINFKELSYDFFFSCCVLYHFGKKKFEEIISDISRNTPEVFLQTNLGHISGELKETSSLEFHKQILEKYGYLVTIKAPEGYKYPIIYGRKK